MTRVTALVTALVMTLFSGISAAEIGYIEDFALAEDRTQALRLLIPGSEDYYFYHCLHLQNTEQFEQVETLLAAWIKRYNYTDRVRQIQTRQALLTYEKNPEQSLEFIRRQLGIEFNHQREALGENPNLPTELDPSLISPMRLIELARQHHQDLSGFEDVALDWLASTELDPDRRRHLLQRLRQPDQAHLAKLVVDDLQHRASQPFGSLPIHRLMLLEQLDECLQRKPDLLDQGNFVQIYLSKLRPSQDVDWRYETREHEAYLDRLWSFVSRLAPVHNSLKAHVLYHRLEFDRTRGIYDKDRFMTYLRLPRSVPYIAAKFMQVEENRRFAADLNANFEAQTLLPPVVVDEPLVRDYLHHFFLSETVTTPYEPYIDDRFLRHQLAETKIVNGLGEPEQWYSLLAPEQYQALKDRIDLDFASTNQVFFAADDAVSLDLSVKNVRTLIVRVFEVNTKNFYREHQREVNTDINLDGLVANNEQTFEYTEPPLRRVRRHFEFPALAKPGVYVVDFIGNGINSRVVIRKGQLRHLVRTTAAGQLFTVVDGNNSQVTDATLWMAGHEYQPNEQGEILVPWSTQPGRQAIVLSRGDFSSLGFFEHQAENYQLAAGIYVDRESLLKNNASKVVVRCGLLLNGSPVSVADLEDVRFTIASVDQDGVESSQEIKDFALFEDRESVHEFQTPPRLARLSFTLQARVQSLSLNKKIDLVATESFGLNEIDQSDRIASLHFAKINESYVLELRGKSGEPLPDRPIQLVLKHRDFTAPVQVSLQTDRDGRIVLGTLEDISGVTATGPDGVARSWPLLSPEHTYYNSLHGIVGEVLEVPYLGNSVQPTRQELSLLELRGETYVADQFRALEIRDGLLHVRGLQRGDYELLFKETGRRIRIRITAGSRVERYLLGSARHLEERGTKPLQISKIDAGEEQLRIQLINGDTFARVHLFATRFQPAFSAFGKLASVRDAEPYLVVPTRLTSLYFGGRSIGDEYQYIIDRRYANKHPGVLADRPSLLLNPWAIRGTTTGQQQAQAGSEFGAAPAPAESVASREAQQDRTVAQVGDFANLDFLDQASAVMLNLVPDKNGMVTIPLAAIGAHQDLHVLAIDPRSTAYRRVSLPERPLKLRDLRLLTGLDPARHFTQQKRISVVEASAQFILPDIKTSRFAIYDTLSTVYALYATLSGDAQLAEFSFLLTWPGLSAEEKQKLYSQHACHELNFFLMKKDPAFFEAVVRPYLANKRDKTFLDAWLLGAELDEYLRPWQYARLNVVERILLSQRLEQDRPHTSRDVLDQFALLPPDVARTNKLFLTAVKGRALDAQDAMGLIAAIEAESLKEMRFGAFALPGLVDSRGGMPDAAGVPATPAADDLGGVVLNGMGMMGRGEDKARDGVARKQEADAKAMLGKRLPASMLALDPVDEAAGKAFFFDRRAKEQSDSLRRLYQVLDQTQEWAENNYYKRPIEQQLAELVSVNSFWRDYAQHNPEQPFRSVNFADATRSFTEMMFAMALLDLPFEAAEHKSEFAEGRMTLTAGSPLIVFHEEIREASPIVEQTPILVSQNFFRHDDRYRHENNEQLDKFVTDEFLVHTVYGCQVVITNPTSSPQKLDVLLQVPRGSLPVLLAQETRSVHVQLQPYSTQTIEYHFYFPVAGQYPHYPVHVAKNEQLLAHAAPVTLTVVEQLSRVDRDSWPYISQYGSGEDVLSYLETHNLHRTDLEKIAFRMGNKAFFLNVIDLLERRHAYHHTLWSYGIRHNVVPAVRQYLQHADGFVQQCGVYLDSPLLTIQPIARHAYQHLDYQPLVNARQHQLGRRRQILNDRLHQQYHQFLTILGYRRELDAADRMALTYYLLLQDRVEEALAAYDRVNPAELETTLQYDYFAAYLNLRRAAPAKAREVTTRYANYPVERWRTAFVAIDRQLDELESGEVTTVDPESRDQRQTALAATAPALDLRVEAKRVQIDYQNLSRVLVNYYLMDIELLFSRNPFVQQNSNQFSQIRPNRSEWLELPAGQRQHEFELPEDFHNRNVLIEVVGAGLNRSQAYFSHALSVQVMDNYGQLRVTSAAEGRPLSTVYVKVYARMQDGLVRFYKDGYTDLRGRFDYSSISTNELDFVDKFAILVLSEEHGTVVREATPPKR